MKQRTIPAAASGRLGVLVVGAGALSTTFIAGVAAVRRGLGKPIGALTQIGHVPGPDDRSGPVPVHEAVPLAGLGDLAFGVWDILPDSIHRAAVKARVLEDRVLEPLRKELEAIRPWQGIYDRRYIRRIEATHRLPQQGHLKNVAQIERDIEAFRVASRLSRLVMLNEASTEVHQALDQPHAELRRFERALAADDPRLSPAMLYAYAALRRRIPVVNCTPSHAVDIPALRELADEMKVPIVGRDLKTGQTLLKTILAPGFRARALGVSGWYSTNILGNRDGEVLDDPLCLKSKEESKTIGLRSILDPELYPDLYGNLVHRVLIDYYPPRG